MAIASAGRDGSVTGSGGATDAGEGSPGGATMPATAGDGRSALKPATATAPRTITPTATAAIVPGVGPARTDERTATPSLVMARAFDRASRGAGGATGDAVPMADGRRPSSTPTAASLLASTPQSASRASILGRQRGVDHFRQLGRHPWRHFAQGRRPPRHDLDDRLFVRRLLFVRGLSGQDLVQDGAE